jgi:hypothetical protein
VNLPAEHVRQVATSFAPSNIENLPPGQFLHEFEDAIPGSDEYFPAGQLMQFLAASLAVVGKYFPASQSLHTGLFEPRHVFACLASGTCSAVGAIVAVITHTV